MTTIADLAKTAEQIAQNVMDHESSINFMAGLIGILPEVQLAEKFLPLLIGALQVIEQDTGKSPLEAFLDLIKHLTPGQPNAPALAPTVSPTDPHQTPE